jgi:hypothetical protein
MKYFNASHADINYYEDQKLVEILWKQTSPNSSSYRLTLTKALIVVKQYGAENWLSDMTILKEVSEDDRRWVESYLVRNCAESGLKKAAFVLNSEIREKIHTPDFDQIVGEQKIEVRSFNMPQDAYKWLGISK